MLNKKLLLIVGIALCGVVLMGAYNRPYRWWNTLLTPLDVEDMNEQISIKAFEPDSLREPPEGAVAVDQWEPFPDRLKFAPILAGQPLPEELAAYANPVPASPDSIAKGEELYTVYCYPCHGVDMSPDPSKEAPVLKRVQQRALEGTVYGFAPFNIHIVKMRSDGYIYGTISQGGAQMKRLDYHLSPEERWHIVNYVRSLADKY